MHSSDAIGNPASLVTYLAAYLPAKDKLANPPAVPVATVTPSVPLPALRVTDNCDLSAKAALRAWWLACQLRAEGRGEQAMMYHEIARDRARLAARERQRQYGW